MKQIALYRKTFRLLEVMAVLILASHSWLHLGSGLEGRTLLFFCADLACLALVLLGLSLNVLRKVSWWAIFGCGWMLIAFHPVQIDGIVLALLALYMIYDSGTLARKPLLLTVLLGAAVLAAQTISLFSGEVSLSEALARAVVTDGFLILLGGVFSRDVGIRESPPTLCLRNYALSEREIQILHLVWGGESSKEVACFLGVSDASVRVSLSKIYRKLGITHGKQLLQLVFTHRIVFEDDAASRP